MTPEAVHTLVDELREERGILDDLIFLVKNGYVQVDDSNSEERYGVTLKGLREMKTDVGSPSDRSVKREGSRVSGVGSLK